MLTRLTGLELGLTPNPYVTLTLTLTLSLTLNPNQVWLAGMAAAVGSALWGARKWFLESFMEAGARKKGALAARLKAIFAIVPYGLTVQ